QARAEAEGDEGQRAQTQGLFAKQHAIEQVGTQAHAEGQAETHLIFRFQRPVQQDQRRPVRLERLQHTGQRHQHRQQGSGQGADEPPLAQSLAVHRSAPLSTEDLPGSETRLAAGAGPSDVDGPAGLAGAGGPSGSAWSCSSRTSVLRSISAAGRASATWNMPVAAGVTLSIRPTGKPGGKRPPIPEVSNLSPTLRSAASGRFGRLSSSPSREP